MTVLLSQGVGKGEPPQTRILQQLVGLEAPRGALETYYTWHHANQPTFAIQGLDEDGKHAHIFMW